MITKSAYIVVGHKTYCLKKDHLHYRRIWRYQRDNQNP